MGVYAGFCAVASSDLRDVLEKPARLRTLLRADASAPPSEPKFILSRLFGPKPDPWRPSQTPEHFDVEKAWHGIHFLLTGNPTGGEGPLAFILSGGRTIQTMLDDGPPRGFTPEELVDIAKALGAIDADKLYEQADPRELAANKIYPEIWKEPKEECIGDLISHLRELKDFLNWAAKEGRGLIITIG